MFEAVRAKFLPNQFPSERAPDSTAVRLNLGCGDKILEGYVNVDIVDERAGNEPDVQADISGPLPFDNDYADETMAIHVIEHFDQWQVADILKEWIRVTKPGGALILECPNLLPAVRRIASRGHKVTGPSGESRRTMWVLYGDPKWKDPLMVHRWAYTPRSLGEAMQAAGLVNVRQEQAQFKKREPRDMRLVGVKPKNWKPAEASDGA